MDVSGFYIFAFVRNPYTRILSEYNWRMRNISAFNEPTGKPMSFVDYCELLLSKWDEIFDDTGLTNLRITNRQHVRPQYKYVDKDVNIYRYENFREECIKIQDAIGIDRCFPKTNIGSYKTKHTDRTIEITNELYAKDFKVFDYELKLEI